MTLGFNLHADTGPKEIINQVNDLIPNAWIIYWFNGEYFFNLLWKCVWLHSWLPCGPKSEATRCWNILSTLTPQAFKGFRMPYLYGGRVWFLPDITLWHAETQMQIKKRSPIICLCGLRWCFEEYTIYERHQIDHVSIFWCESDNIFKKTSR